MPKLSDLDPTKSAYFLLFVGESGSGKTCAIASYPKPFINDYDGRIEGVLPMQKRKIYNYEVEYKTWAPPAGWAHISKDTEQLKMNLIVNKANYQSFLTYGYDSLTSMCRMLLEESMDLQKGNIIRNPYDETIKLYEKDPNHKDFGKHSLRLSSPSDYKYEGEGIYQFLSTLRGVNTGIYGVKLNIIFTAHIINLYGKPDDDKGNEQTFADTIVIGKKISLRDKVQTNLLTVFNEVYHFTKDKKGRHFVQFNSEVARSVLIPDDYKEHEITGKNFYDFWQQKIAVNYPQMKKEEGVAV